MQRPQVLSQVIDIVFDAVKIRSVARDTVDGGVTLGRGGLGLDSIDILEVVVAVEHEFGIKIADKVTGQAVFRSLGTIADYVQAHSPRFAPQ
jgi:acyl carrier protein